MLKQHQSMKRIQAALAAATVALAAWLPASVLLSERAAAQDQASEDQGQPLGDGVLNATAYQPIPAGTAFDTVVQDPADPSRSVLEGAAVDRVNGELAKAGYHVSREAPLVMLVGTDLIRGTSKEATVDEFRGTGDTGFTYQHNLYSNNKRSLFNKPDPNTTPNTFRISLSVYDRNSGLYVWRGSIDRGTSDLTPDKAADRMIPAIVAAIGKTVKGQNVPLGHD